MTKDELFDDELCSMVKFTDAQEPAVSAQAKTPAPVAKKTRPAQPKPETSAGTGVEIAQPRNVEPLKECAKRVLPLGAMSLLVFYWQQSGQMLTSASMPCIYVFAILAGVAIGKLIGSVNK